MPFIIAFLGVLWSRLLVFLTTSLPVLFYIGVRLLGFGFVTYIGLDIGLEYVKEQVLLNYNNLPADLLNILSLAKIDQGIKIIFACYAVAISIKTAIAARKVVFGQSGTVGG